ncbi:MFS transporter [Pseudomonas sp. LRF_L74]|uniref:MFS transporter n=1 Tax=Pseudomonas sp. LRF_L74 TaxID=3369422 RepID=UPI003F5DCC95
MTTKRWWPQHLLLGWLNLVLTAPIIYLYVGLPLVLRQQGWSGTEIGLLQLAGLPAMLKFILATPVDRYRLGRSSYRNWALLLGSGYAVALLIFAAHDLQNTPRPLLFALAVLVNLLGVWADVPVNALAIRILPPGERIRAGAVRSAATSLGAIGGGGVMLLIHARLGWAWPFRVLALGLLGGMLLVPLLRTMTPVQADEIGPKQVDWRQWPGYFATAQRRVWAVLVLLYFPFIGSAWLYLKPLLLDQGFAAERVAMLVGIAGGVLGALASLGAARITRLVQARVALPLFAFGNLVALLLLIAALGLQLGPQILVVAALTVALAMGASAGLVFGLMMEHTRPSLDALDYGIQSSLFIAARTCVPLLAGILLDRFGYVGMLSGLLLGVGIALALAWSQRERVCGASHNLAASQR